MTKRALLLFIFVYAGVLCSMPESKAYGLAALQQIKTLQSVVTVRQNYFVPPASASVAAKCLVDVKNNLQLFIDDCQYSEVGWFLEQIAKIIGTVGNDVAVGKDISATLYEFRRWADHDKSLSTRVWSTTFCVAVMQRIFDQLVQALQLIPQMTLVVPQPSLLMSELSRSLDEKSWSLSTPSTSRWSKIPAWGKWSIIGSSIVVTIAGITYVLKRE